MKIKKQALCVILILLMIMMMACSQVAPLPAESDWRDRYGTGQNSEVTFEPKVTSNVQDIQATNVPKSEYEDMESAVIPEFIPKEDQVELVLMLDQYSGFALEQEIVMALNWMLREKGYSFYLTVERGGSSVSSPGEWLEALESGEKLDLLYFCTENTPKVYEDYGNRSILRAIKEGYLLPFSEYPETEEKQRLFEAYPMEYWELNAVQGEIYGIAGSVSNTIKEKNYVMLNLDAAEQLGIAIPEQLNLENLDELLQQAEEAGIPGIYGIQRLIYSNIFPLSCGLYLKYEEYGHYRIVNPMEDKEMLALWDAGRRYKQNGWSVDDPTLEKVLPLVICLWGNSNIRNSGQYTMKTSHGEASAKVKIYKEFPRFVVEGDMSRVMGIASSSEHKEEALTLLCLMHTDEDVIKLLRYGIENVHYSIAENGEIELIKGAIRAVDPIGNRLMHLEFEEEHGIGNEEQRYYNEISEIEKIPYMEEFTREQMEELKQIRAITYQEFGQNGAVVGYMDESAYIVNISAMDYDEEIKKKTIAFSEAGYNELAEEINEKYGLK